MAEINLKVCKCNTDADMGKLVIEALPQSSQWQSDRHDHIKVIMWIVHVYGHFTGSLSGRILSTLLGTSLCCL